MLKVIRVLFIFAAVVFGTSVLIPSPTLAGGTTPVPIPVTVIVVPSPIPVTVFAPDATGVPITVQPKVRERVAVQPRMTATPTATGVVEPPVTPTESGVVLPPPTPTAAVVPAEAVTPAISEARGTAPVVVRYVEGGGISTLDLLLGLAVIVATLSTTFIAWINTKQWASVASVLAQVDHSKPALDLLEPLGTSVPGKIVAMIIQALAPTAKLLLTDPDADKAMDLLADIAGKASDGKDNVETADTSAATAPKTPEEAAAIPG